MQDMSDLRKSIAERLGSAGKVKSGRAEQVMRDGTVHLDFRAAKEWLSGVTDSALRYIISDAQQAAKAMPEGSKWNYYHDLSLTAQDELQRRKKKSSRPGAKAKMGADDELRDIIGKAEQILYSPRLLKWEVEEVKELIRRAEASIGGTKLPGLSKRLAQVKAKAAQHFSRPGAKAKFSAQFEVGKIYQHNFIGDSDARVMWKIVSRSGSMITIQQVGAGDVRSSVPISKGETKRVKINTDSQGEFVYPMGRYSMAPVLRSTNQSGFSRPGAKAKFAEDAFHGTFGGKPGLQIDIGKGAEGGINRLIVKLDRGSDTYDMEFWRVAKRGMDVKKVSEASGVYADDLQRIFTSRTKFYTSLSRPGAKAKMAYQPSEADWKKWLKGWTLRMPQVSDAGIRHFNSFEEAKRYADEKCGGFACVISHDGQRVASKSALAGATGSWTTHSRPGAKGSSKAKA
jgi:hypothetical protein